ncbi:MAG TPA: DUF4019 domain-containing protein, partial [Deltaproteobacteria bacterium]|nr:DUF4019 domain-containing protein [Deltaproteobacteria bacterium]
MFRNVLTGLMAACIMLAGTTLPAAEPIEGKAVEAALQWLALVDKGDYAGSLKESADYFKGAIREEQWKQAMEGVRGPLGKALGRTLKTAEHRTSLPGAPDGDYV